ncbi:unnamed protein product [Caenorhabditis auriculariae]|uniref:Transcription initiation factor TFIID subunit 12 n=1 Tax=Caenorhabditis auriculariae TaxID=2777116 RepID=A0A8S1GYZ0_9PELO|nr:unnamed protein product [Caenorhabditis auriculariae]
MHNDQGDYNLNNPSYNTPQQQHVIQNQNQQAYYQTASGRSAPFGTSMRSALHPSTQGTPQQMAYYSPATQSQFANPPPVKQPRVSYNTSYYTDSQMPVGQALTRQVVQQKPIPVHISASSSGSVLEKVKLDQLVKQVNPNTVLEENVKDALIEYADEMVDELVEKVCHLVKNRGSDKILARDVEFVLKNKYQMPTVPRAAVNIYGGNPAGEVPDPRNVSLEAHRQRQAMLKKQSKRF